MTKQRLVTIGRAVKPFGIRGEIKIQPFTESFGTFERSSELTFGQIPFKVLRIRIHKGAVLATLQGVDSPEKASGLVGNLVGTDEGNLPEKEDDEYFWHELIGIAVTTVDGRELGTITQIIPTGANDVLQVEGDYGEVLLPMIDQVVLEVNVAHRTMLVDPLEGLIPDD